MSDKTTQHKVGSFVKTKRGEVHKVLGQIGTTLHATKYHGKGLYGGNVILHSSNVYPVSAPTDMKESIDQYCLAISDNVSFTNN